MSAKSVDLQTTVPRANEVSRALRLQSGQEYVQAQEVASGQKRQAERAAKAVQETGKALGGRVEAKRPPRDGRSGREKKGKAREKGKGNLLDITCDG
ncbi:MAG TPA: hypothetical protein DCM14_03690 [Clostridiales bacterium UBA8153]|nr:hypothetical protein [Clostridiales bacterium UBA8153]